MRYRRHIDLGSEVDKGLNEEDREAKDWGLQHSALWYREPQDRAIWYRGMEVRKNGWGYIRNMQYLSCPSLR